MANFKKDGKAKHRGIILHIANLPGDNSIIGELWGKNTKEFIDFMAKCKQDTWGINPLTPIGSDLSPYNSSSRFERNKYLINLNLLSEKEYGPLLPKLPPIKRDWKFSLPALEEEKDPLFREAYKNFKSNSKNPLKTKFNKFCKEKGKEWLDNNTLFEGIQNALKRKYNEKGEIDPERWSTWPKDLIEFPEKTKDLDFQKKVKYINEKKLGGISFEEEDIIKMEQFRFEQFLFFYQFNKLNNYLKEKGIKLLVDLAYAVSPEGKDVWASKNIVMLDENYKPAILTGCMPEDAYRTTQLWGQAVWNYKSQEYWDYQEKSVGQLLEEGIVRLDHFGGLVNRGAIPVTVERKDIIETLLNPPSKLTNPLWLKEERNNLLENNGIDPYLFESLEIEKQRYYLNKILVKENYSIFEIKSPLKEGGLGLDCYWQDDWLEDVSKYTNPKTGENLIDLYLRVAKEKGHNPEDAFLIEDAGGVGITKNFFEFMETHSKVVNKPFKEILAAFRLPIADGLGDGLYDGFRWIDDPNNTANPWNFGPDSEKDPDGEYTKRCALVSSTHDKPSLMETVYRMLHIPPQNYYGQRWNVSAVFREFCKTCLKIGFEPERNLFWAGLPDEEIAFQVTKEILNWMYKKPAKFVIVSISEVLGIFYRVNIPGTQNRVGKNYSKPQGFYMFPPYTEEGRRENFYNWGTTLPEGFLSRSIKEGGYKERAEEFLKNQLELFGDE